MTSNVVPFDYDDDPERFQANVRAVERYGLASDVHADVAARLAEEGLQPVLDLGCGEGRLLRLLQAQGTPAVAFDYSHTMLNTVSGWRVRGDARELPFGRGSFGGVAALYMLYHLPDPKAAIAESQRVLCSGGLFFASAPSRHNDPELAAVLPPEPPAPFDAENGPAQVERYFQIIAVERWDMPLVYLPDRTALLLYLRGRQLSADEIEVAAAHLSVPLSLTKRGALIIARKPT